MIIISTVLKNKNYKFINIILVILLVINVVINNILFNSKVIIDILWIISIFIIILIPRCTVYRRKIREAAYTCAFIFGVLYIVLNLFLGFITGFGASPYNHSLMGVLSNIIRFGLVLVGSELTRSYLINSNKPVNKELILFLAVVLLSLTEIRLSLISSINTLNKLVIFLSEDILPIVFKNIFLSYLVVYGGAKASLIYLSIIHAFELFFPILPDMNWLFKVTLEVGIPMVGVIYIKGGYINNINNKKLIRGKDESLIRYIPTAVISLLVIWFVVGVFKVYPTAIVTGSMEPIIYPGDVVLVSKLQSIEEVEELNVGDVIQFKREDIIINHRITEIIDKDGQLLFRTKGDNNSAEDMRLVKVDELKGKIVKVIPKVGLITMFIKSDKTQDLMELEF